MNSLEREVTSSRTELLVRKGRDIRAVVDSKEISSSSPVRLPISSRQVIKFRHKENNL